VRCTFNHLSHYLTICLTTKLFLLRPLKLNQKIIPVLLLIFLSFLFAWYLSVSPRADLFSSTLSCNKKEEKNHQTSHFECAPPVNQASNFGRERLFQSVRQKFYHLHTSTESSPSTSHGLGLPPPTCPNS
jgi:hypothetical protein